MRTVVMIYEKFPPFNLSGSTRAFRFAKYLPQFGFTPHVLAARVPPGEVSDARPLLELDTTCAVHRSATMFDKILPLLRSSLRGWPARERTTSSEARTELPVDPLPAPVPLSDSVPAWLFPAFWTLAWRLHWYCDWGAPATLMGLRTAMSEQLDLIWASAPHFRNLFAGYVLSLLLRKPLVLDIRDPWTYGSLWHPRTKGTEHAERTWADRILGHADRIVFNSPLTQEQMQSRFPAYASRMLTITNGFATTAPVTRLRHFSQEKCVFGYVGTLNERRTPDVLLAGLHAACRDPELARDVRLQFVGGMAGHEASIARQGLDDQVVSLGKVSQRESLGYMRGSDVNVLLQTITTGQDVISGKAFEYLAAGRPILAIVSRSGGDAWLMRTTGAGTIVPFDDADAVGRVIREHWDRWRHGRLAMNMEPEALERFDPRRLTGQLAAVFDEVLTRGDSEPHERRRR